MKTDVRIKRFSRLINQSSQGATLLALVVFALIALAGVAGQIRYPTKVWLFVSVTFTLNTLITGIMLWKKPCQHVLVGKDSMRFVGALSCWKRSFRDVNHIVLDRWSNPEITSQQRMFTAFFVDRRGNETHLSPYLLEIDSNGCLLAILRAATSAGVPLNIAPAAKDAEPLLSHFGVVLKP